MRIAAVDLGTNSFLCLISDVDPGRPLKIIEDICRVVRLGEKVNQNRYFLPEALSRAAVALEEFSQLIKKYSVETVVATATSAARDASNGIDLLNLGQKFGIPISIIGGEKEAQLSFEGALSGLSRKAEENILVIDVGGGSTELIFRPAKTQALKAQSFDVGCVRLTEMFLTKDPVDQNEFKKLSAYAIKKMQSFGPVKPNLVLAVAGTPTTLACVEQKIDFESARVDGFKMSTDQISNLILKLGQLPLAQRKNLKGLEPLRADVIVAGGALLLAALEIAGSKELTVSTRGLRYGVALHYKEFLK